MADARTTQRDSIRRYTRRGVARAVLEAEAAGNEGYFETHEIASEFRGMNRRKLNYWASEQNPTTSTGVKTFGMSVALHPKAATWP